MRESRTTAGSPRAERMRRQSTRPRAEPRQSRRAAIGERPSSLAWQPVHLKDVQPAAVGAQHLDAQAVDGDRFAALGKAPEAVDHEPADSVEIGVGELRPEGPIEIGDFRLCLDAVVSPLLAYDVVLRIVEVVFVLDVAD